MPLALLLLTTSCSETGEQTVPDKPGAAVRGSTPVGFSAYTQRGVTRAGYAGVLAQSQLEESEANGGGFGVFAYYTDLKRYDQTYIPNFMYNVGVFKSGSAWAYSPVMYWPNESGSSAQSDDEDKVTFFAYAPFVRHSSAASGSVSDATYGITGFSRNSTVGDPIVKYIASFDPAKSVDLCWGVCAADTWAKYQGTTNQAMTAGLPWLNVEHPQGIDQKMTFTFKHALSQLNVQVDADPDIAVHDESATIAAGNKVYVRSISFTGIATHGALNLNNTVADEPLWLDYGGTTDLPYGQSVTVHDGRRDGREGASGAEATNELPQGLNPQIVQNSTTTTGVTHELQNLFNGAATTTPVYVIPTGEKMTVTIVYDVETVNPALSGYTSDGVNHGVSVENKITKDITWSGTTGLEAGKNYTLKLHLGLNSVKFDAAVADWDDSAINGNGWLPHNIATDPPVGLNLGTSLTMAMSGGSGTPQTITATTKPAGEAVYWSNTDDNVASIAAAAAPARAGFLGGTRAVQENIGPCQSVTITPHAAGTTIVTARTAYGSAQCVVTVTVSGSKASVTTAPTGKTSLTYNNSDQALLNSDGVAENGTMWYATGNSTPSGWSGTIPTGKNAGTYNVWYKAKGNTGYDDSDVAGPIEVTIAKKSASISYAETSVSKTTADGAFTNPLTNTGDGTVSYGIANVGSNVTINESTGQITSLGSTAGTATITATVTPDANHSYASTTATYTITVTVDSNVQVNSPSINGWGSGGNVDGTGDKHL